MHAADRKPVNFAFSNSKFHRTQSQSQSVHSVTSPQQTLLPSLAPTLGSLLYASHGNGSHDRTLLRTRSALHPTTKTITTAPPPFPDHARLAFLSTAQLAYPLRASFPGTSDSAQAERPSVSG
ncbi:hypothetical protein A1Q2_01438 [Trichosporon asahii var. asahii CBS 8904]|uniref:Uncharacterized protein n=1 Tax=Trichosporon asahii var. asahii (strain CBS 8904) TaxID=1220162 RepID=K1WTL1_TRIAC|nr:hypothetical protein A1Q2_01438 [Trichosporon asahii var. asahii CBS 8904]